MHLCSTYSDKYIQRYTIIIITQSAALESNEISESNRVFYTIKRDKLR